MSNSTSEPPNPTVWLAWLDPDLATDFEISQYIAVATLGAWVWDVLTSLRQEFRLVRNKRFGWPTGVYFLSRAATLTFLTVAVTFKIGEPDDCWWLQQAIGITYVIALAFDSLLFLFRIRAVLAGHPLLQKIYLLLWFGNLGVGVAFPFALSAGNIGPTKHCINKDIKSYAAATPFASAAYDTLVFLGITWKLYVSSYERPVEEDGTIKKKRSVTKMLLRGEGMPALSQAIFQGGQEYYLATIIVNLLCSSLISVRSLPHFIGGIFSLPKIAVENAMVCRVYRDIKLGVDVCTCHTRESQPLSLPMFARQNRNPKKGQTTTFGLTTSMMLNSTAGSRTVGGAAGDYSLSDVPIENKDVKTVHLEGIEEESHHEVGHKKSQDDSSDIFEMKSTS